MKLKYGIAMAAIAGLVFVGCGDDPPATNNNPTTNNNNPTTNNNNPTTNNNNPTTNNNNPTTNNNNPTTNNNNPMPDVDPPKCSDPNPPARCGESPDGYAWGTASIINTFAIAAGDEECCFDYNGDGVPDNALGGILEAFGLPDINASIQDGIDSGSIALLLEHSGLTALTGGNFTINFWLGIWDGITELAQTGNTIAIDPVSIDAGTQPQAYVPGATLTAAGAVTAGPGTILLTLELLGTPLSLRISGARVTASVDAANSSLDNGVSLNNGKLGGYVKVADVMDAINLYASTCDCLGLNGGNLVNYNPATVTATCATVTDTCAEGDTCSTIATQCPTLAGVIGFIADVDADGDGTEDALSIGATFTAAGATITGVADN